jgi:hypothetical protein
MARASSIISSNLERREAFWLAGEGGIVTIITVLLLPAVGNGGGVQGRVVAEEEDAPGDSPPLRKIVFCRR